MCIVYKKKEGKPTLKDNLIDVEPDQLRDVNYRRMIPMLEIQFTVKMVSSFVEPLL